jgi:hypothetical protein
MDAVLPEKFISISEIDEDTRYKSLVSNYGIETDAKLGYGDRGRGLFSTRVLEPGTDLVVICQSPILSS